MPELRCKKCHRLLLKYEPGGAIEIKCPYCNQMNTVGPKNDSWTPYGGR